MNYEYNYEFTNSNHHCLKSICYEYLLIILSKK